MKRSSIYKKLFTNILAVSIAALLLFGVAGIAGITIFAGLTEDALIEQMEKTLNVQVADKAEFIEEKLSKYASDTSFYAQYASNLFLGWDQLPERRIDVLQESSESDFEGYTLNILMPNNMAVSEISPDMRSHMDKLCNIAYTFEAREEGMGICAALYMSSEKYGYTLMYDKFPKQYNNFDPRNRPWYIDAEANGKVIWTEPYVDTVSGELMITCSAPFYDTVDAFAGVVGLDIYIAQINAQIVNISFSDSGFAFAVNKDGDYVASSEIALDGGDYKAQSAKKDGQEGYNSIIDRMTSGEKGLVSEKIDGVECFIAFAPVSKNVDWSVAIVVQKAEIIKPAVDTGIRITAIIISVFAAVFVVIIFAVVLLSGKISKNLSNPIMLLKTEVEKAGGGNLDFKNHIQTGDEIQSLAESFEKMTGDLRGYIKNLAFVTAEKERIGAELNVATQIQASMLPCIFPAFPERDEFEIYASMQPAKEVGGDFYDFFLVDDDNLAVVIADVSGKGVPAALFMVIAKTLIKNYAQTGKNAADTLIETNKQLCEGNDAGLFVTAWLGILQISTGKLTFANAGHNAPVLKKAGDSFKFLKNKASFVLAGMEDTKYKQSEIMLEKDDMLFLYTDGVTEASNVNEELFGDSRLLGILESCKSLVPANILTTVKRGIDSFVAGEQQFDDITMLCLKLKK